MLGKRCSLLPLIPKFQDLTGKEPTVTVPGSCSSKSFPLSKVTEAKRDTRREDLPAMCVHSIPLGEHRSTCGWVLIFLVVPIWVLFGFVLFPFCGLFLWFKTVNTGSKENISVIEILITICFPNLFNSRNNNFSKPSNYAVFIQEKETIKKPILSLLDYLQA